MKKVLTTFSIIVISLFALSVFGWMSFHISLGDKNFGFLTGPVRFMYTFPDLFSQSVEEVKTLPRTFIPTPDDFESVNELEDDFIALLTYSDTSDSRSIVLLNLKDDSVLYKWTVDNPYQEHDRIWNPLLFPERNLVYSFHGTGLWRIDSLNHVVWKQDSIFAHHSMELDSNGDIWICSYEPVYYATGHYKINGRSVFYKDNCITKIDAETGNILFHKSVTAILRENGLSNYILKSQNILDPLHINDVQPALRSTSYYKEGDVFISARQASFIMHYRPSTNEVLKMIEGPFVCQHDVDFLTDNSLAIFNNNYYEIWTVDSKPAPRDSGRLEIAGDFYSNLVRYDFDTERISFIGDSVFRANRIFTQTEGLMEFVDPSTYFIEEQNSGVIWIIRDDQVIYKNVLKSQHKGYHHLPNWIRIIKQYD